MERRVATWCAALQHGAPCCNSVALRSAELTRLGGCKLRHVAFRMRCRCAVLQHPVLHHDAVAQHVKACHTSAPAAVRRSRRGACASRRARHCVETEPCGRHPYSALKKHSMLRQAATAMPTTSMRAAPMPGESRAGCVLRARICIRSGPARSPGLRRPCWHTQRWLPTGRFARVRAANDGSQRSLWTPFLRDPPQPPALASSHGPTPAAAYTVHQ
jgi:hypothetical protein